ncbi:HK97-gp10 family putative phage morphogenesis protein [Streptomyces mirabilis]
MSVRGSDALLKQLDHVTSRMHQAVRQAVEESAESVVAGTKRRVNVDTGNLKASVKVHMHDGATIKADIGWKDRADRYALWQEFGTQAMPARPALGPAFNAEKRKISQRIAKAIEKVIGG